MTARGPFVGVLSQYGFEFHFGVDALPEGGAVVFNTFDGCVWARLPADKNANGYDHSIYAAHNLCHAFNGHPRTALPD